MSSFTKPLLVKVLDDGRTYELLEDFEYYRDNESFKIFVKKGFRTDFASIPRILWSIYPPFGKYSKSALLHDFLCEAFLNKKQWQEISNLHKLELVTRKMADEIFLESMRAVGVPFLSANILYLGVRVYAVFKYGKGA